MEDLGEKIRRVAAHKKSLALRRDVLRQELDDTKVMATNARTEIRNMQADLDYLDIKIKQLEVDLKNIDDELEALGSER